MKINPTLHPDQYNLCKALTYGICRGHFKKCKTETTWQSKTIHFIIASAELLLIIGQIAALLELAFVKLRSSSPISQKQTIDPPLLHKRESKKLAEPISCKPCCHFFKRQETPESPFRIWPEDLTLLGLKNEEMETIDQVIKNVLTLLVARFKEITLTWTKRSVKCIDIKEQKTAFEAILPITWGIFETARSTYIFLFPKTAFISGGERKIRWCYNSTTGSFFLKKRIVGLFEKFLIGMMQDARQKRGISTSELLWREGLDKKGRKKLQLIEPLRDGNLLILFGKEPFANFSTRYSLIKDLLQEIKDLHQIKIRDIFFTRAGIETPLPPYGAFHLDIKLENLLVSKELQRWRGEISDFGESAAHPKGACFSVGFTSPEYIQFYKEIRPLGIDAPLPLESSAAFVDFNLEYAQKRDIWAMGLVLLAIALGKTEVVKWKEAEKQCSAVIAPLQCLKRAIESTNNKISHYPEEGVLNLTQDELDRELEKLEQEMIIKENGKAEQLKPLFKVIKEMLQIDPKKRFLSDAN